MKPSFVGWNNGDTARSWATATMAVPNGNFRNNAKTRGNHPSVSKQDDGYPLSRFVLDFMLRRLLRPRSSTLPRKWIGQSEFGMLEEP
jgi:hypothetical protein